MTVNGSNKADNIGFSSITSSRPIWAFNGAYSNYSLVVTNNSRTMSAYLYYRIISVNDTTGMIYVFQSNGTVGGASSNSHENISWNNFFPFAVNSTVLAGLNSGNASSVGLPADVKINVAFTTPMGTLTTDELFFPGQGENLTMYVDMHSGIMAGLLFANKTFSGKILLSSTNIPTGLKATYSATFTETGLPLGSTWYVNVSGEASSGPITTNTYNESLQNGSYTYSIGTSDKSYAASGGTFKVNGTNVPVPVTFEKVYSITFTETGLPTGTTWYVNETAPQSAPSSPITGSLFTVYVPNGTYSYTASSTNPSYMAKNGTFTVSGHKVTETIAFTHQSGTSSFPINSGTMMYIIVGAVITIDDS